MDDFNGLHIYFHFELIWIIRNGIVSVGPHTNMRPNWNKQAKNQIAITGNA